MNNYAPPATIIELAGIAIIIIGGLLRLRMTQRQQAASIDQMHDKVDAVHTQTVNDHPHQPNMRDQIDRIEAIVGKIDRRQDITERDMTALRVDVGGLRQEFHTEVDRSTRRDDHTDAALAEERQRSIETDAALRDSITKLHQDTPPL